MKFESKRLNIFGGMLQIQLPINLISDAEKIQKDINAGKSYVIDISRKRQKRSLDANAFLWACLADMAAKLQSCIPVKTNCTCKCWKDMEDLPI